MRSVTTNGLLLLAFLVLSCICHTPDDTLLDFELGKSKPSMRYGFLTRGGWGNVVIQFLYARLYALERNGFVAPPPRLIFAGEEHGGHDPERMVIWAPRLGHLAACGIKGRNQKQNFSMGSCPGKGVPSQEVKNQVLGLNRAKRPVWDRAYHQNYNYFRGWRDICRFLLATTDQLPPDELERWTGLVKPGKLWSHRGPPPGPNDAVLHLRIMNMQKQEDHGMVPLCYRLRKGHETPPTWEAPPALDELLLNQTCDRFANAFPLEFFEGLLAARARRLNLDPGTELAARGGWDKLWLVTEPHILDTDLAKKLVSHLGFEVHPTLETGLPAVLEDFWFLKSARHIIQTSGTFSWAGAFLSNATEVHKPYTSNNWGGLWAEEAALFVDDQPTYFYHNAEDGRFFLTADEVLADTNSAFVRMVQKRPPDVIRLPRGKRRTG